MEIMVFFNDGTSSNYDIQTYYKNDETLYTLVLSDGSFTVLDNVSHMIKIK